MHLDQGHCITSYASQCRTVRQVVPLAGLNALGRFDAKTLYTFMSRATHEMHLYTDCEEALMEAVLRRGDRKSIWEYTRDAAREAKRKVQVELERIVDLQPGNRIVSRRHRTSRTQPQA
jgi:hypothetical protein